MAVIALNNLEHTAIYTESHIEEENDPGGVHDLREDFQAPCVESVSDV